MASTDSANPNGGELSAAQKLQQLHDENHKATLEDVPDEDDLRHGPTPVSSSVLEGPGDEASTPGWVAPVSAKAVGKQKAGNEKKPFVDIQSEELFPGLGGPKPAQAASSVPRWGAKTSGAANGNSNGAATNGTSTPTSGLNTPTTQSRPKGAPQSLAGQNSGPLFILQPNEVLSRRELKRPIPDVLKDINKKTRANLSMTTGEGGVLKFSATGAVPDSVKHQAFRDLGAQVCAKSAIKVPVPRSSKAHIIGRSGANIKSMQEATGARINLPKDDGAPAVDEDDDEEILVNIEGTPFAIALAKAAINKTLNERSSSVNTRVRNVPAEFYPFIGGPNNSRVNALEEKHGVQIRVPPHYKWTSQPPPKAPSSGQAPAFLPAAGDNNITLAGDRAAVQAARTEIDQLVQELRQQLKVKQEHLPISRHQYIIGERGISPQEFLAKTGCAVILPPGTGSDPDQEITFIGASDREIEAAIEEAMDLASSMQNSVLDISRQHRSAPGGGRIHARNITQYLRDRKEIERLEQAHGVHIVTQMDSEGAEPWDIFYREGPKNLKAQAEIASIINAHPPTRMASVPVDPFFHPFIRKDITPVVKKDYGVHVVIPNDNETGAPVLLVFEGSPESQYQVPRGQPSADEVKAFKQGLEDARRHILNIIEAQAQITSTEIEVPRIFHEKLRRFIKKEQEQRAADQIPVRVHPAGTKIILRGPEPAVKSLSAKIEAFVAEAIEDEKERGFTLSFDYPQKHANQLIGKGGSNIRELRDRFDVEINVEDGKVTLKGPKAKAEAAKAHISALGRQWADETTHIIKIDPKYHGEIIGSSGAQINKLQDKYKVQIHFPRAAKPGRDDQSNADAASEAGRRPRREQAPDEVSIKGPTKGADATRDEILSLLQYLKDISNVAVISVQAGQIPSLIGTKGRELDEIRRITEAKIEVPNARDLDPSTRVEIQIKGTASQVAQAKKLIAEKRDVFDQTVTKTLSVDKKHHRALIGREGSVLRDIVVKAGGSDDRRELARTVQFPKAEADGNLIKVEGKEDLVDKIIASMEAIVAELASQTSETIQVPTSKHRLLIGRGGDAKKEIERKFKVTIDIPRQGSEETGVKIAGQPADVEKAKTHIETLIKEQEGETIQVPRSVHHSVADNGQFFRRLRNDLQVSVDHGNHKVPPKSAPPANARATSALPLITDDAEASSDAHSWNVINTGSSDLEGEIPWILRGPADNIATAKSRLQKAIEQASKNTSTGYLVLPDPRTYRYVIGQGGSKVNSIRKQSGCTITVPKAQAENEAIEVVGSAEGVEKAKELILKAVKEGAANNGGGNGKSGQGNWD